MHTTRQRTNQPPRPPAGVGACLTGSELLPLLTALPIEEEKRKLLPRRAIGLLLVARLCELPPPREDPRPPLSVLQINKTNKTRLKRRRRDESAKRNAIARAGLLAKTVTDLFRRCAKARSRVWRVGQQIFSPSLRIRRGLRTTKARHNQAREHSSSVTPCHAHHTDMHCINTCKKKHVTHWLEGS